MLPEAVPGLPDEGCHVQLQNDRCRIERCMLSQHIVAAVPLADRGKALRRPTRSMCHVRPTRAAQAPER